MDAPLSPTDRSPVNAAPAAAPSVSMSVSMPEELSASVLLRAIESAPVARVGVVVSAVPDAPGFAASATGACAMADLASIDDDADTRIYPAAPTVTTAPPPPPSSPVQTTSSLPFVVTVGVGKALAHPAASADGSGERPTARDASPTEPKREHELPELLDVAAFGRSRGRYLVPLVLAATAASVAIGITLGHGSGSGAMQSSAESAPAVTLPIPTGNEPVIRAALPAPPTEPTARAASPATVCSSGGPMRELGTTALPDAGIELRPWRNAIAIGVAATPHEAALLEVDPSTLALRRMERVRSSKPVVRATPIAAAGALALAVDTERKSDPLKGRRTVNLAAPLDIGLLGDALAWSPHRSRRIALMGWLEGAGPLEALNTAPMDRVGPAPRYAIAFRRGGFLWVGSVAGRGAPVFRSAPSKIVNFSSSADAPALAAQGDALMMAWADRLSEREPWRLRWVRWKDGNVPAEVKEFVLPGGGPGGQTTSPALAPVGTTGFLLAWVEGSGATQQVRATMLSLDGVPVGAPIAVSPAVTAASRLQVALTPEGKGLVGFIAADGRRPELHAAPVVCTEPPRAAVQAAN